MNVPILTQTTVIRTLCVPTLKVPTYVVVSKDTLETASVVQVLLSIQINTVVVKTQQNLRNLFEKKWKMQCELLMSLLVMFIVISCFFYPPFFAFFKEKLLCDLPCTANKVCKNYAGVPECVCKDGYIGEDNCAGTMRKKFFFLVVFQNSSVRLLSCFK